LYKRIDNSKKENQQRHWYSFRGSDNQGAIKSKSEDCFARANNRWWKRKSS
jgi:hypothetical protein